jgi:hypothetical protein
MKSKINLLIIVSFLSLNLCKAQNFATDSLEVVNTFKNIISLCKNVDFSDPKVLEIGTFYKVAPFIIYRGDDKKRAWKDFANYNNEDEKNGVDNVCFKINQTVNQDSSYKILKFHKEKESEGEWNVLQIEYVKKGKTKIAAFAFLKVKNKFGLGDID